MMIILASTRPVCPHANMFTFVSFGRRRRFLIFTYGMRQGRNCVFCEGGELGAGRTNIRILLEKSKAKERVQEASKSCGGGATFSVSPPSHPSCAPCGMRLEKEDMRLSLTPPPPPLGLWGWFKNDRERQQPVIDLVYYFSISHPIKST